MAGVVTVVDNGKGEVEDLKTITIVVIFNKIPPGGNPLSGEPALWGRQKEDGRLDGGFSQRWALSSDTKNGDHVDGERPYVIIVIIMMVNIDGGFS